MTRSTPTITGAVPVSVGLATRSFVDTPAAVHRSPFSTLPLIDLRAVRHHAQTGTVPVTPGGVKARRIVVTWGEEVSIMVVRPPGATGHLPAVVYVHSGDWIIDNAGTHEAPAPGASAEGRDERRTTVTHRSSVARAAHTPGEVTTIKTPVGLAESAETQT